MIALLVVSSHLLTCYKSLRHVFHHGTYLYPELHRKYDVSVDAEVMVKLEESSILHPAPKLRIKSAPVQIQRLVDRRRSTIDAILEAGRAAGRAIILPVTAWNLEETSGPNITDKGSVLSFAKITANAYVTGPSEPDWEDITGAFNYTEDFGWQADGLRGHIFADTENRTVVIGLKGTCRWLDPAHSPVDISNTLRSSGCL